MPSQRRIYALLLRKSGRVKSFFCSLLFLNYLQLEAIFSLHVRVASCAGAPHLHHTQVPEFVILHSRGSSVACPKLQHTKDGPKRARTPGKGNLGREEKEQRSREKRTRQHEVHRHQCCHSELWSHQIITAHLLRGAKNDKYLQESTKCVHI